MKLKSLFLSACVITAASSPCFAVMEIADVSPARAKELGMEIQSKACGPDQVWVELAVKTEGELKNFVRVDLQMREGEKFLVIATLKENPYRSKPGRVAVGFTVDRSLLQKTSLMVVFGVPMNMNGYEVRLKDFVPAELLRKGK